ncbi:MAG: hypothetical protein LKH27_02685 [Prevotella sp.]|jgi:hypothetical protein|nr:MULTISPECIES: hypothetical protein [unclassified Prevotella]MCH3971127.1 hypothetical protein [Prevotella sp.]MCH3991137.1 hypothetical protein [Prevotella sp.]MCH4018300.1 hypothetical protein [Prevotella sp.]MCH4100622.1 hypothetical protein [Prevotella sp.]MCH4186438.1 hypothetical protein [Prevotella sp.]
MAEIIITPKKQKIAIPHYLSINGQILGVMKDAPIHLRIPTGTYNITIKSMFKFIESSTTVPIVNDEDVCEVQFCDRERIWNILFNIDMVLWLIKRIIHIGAPWDAIYESVSNGFFAIWLIRVWIIRKKYFKMKLTRLNG